MGSQTAVLLYYVLLAIRFLTASCSVVQCEPAEIGTTHSISCSSSGVVNSIKWIKAEPQTDLTLCTCLTSTNCVSYYPNVYAGVMEYLNGVYKSTLVIYNVSLTDAVPFKCIVDSQPPVDVCNVLQVFTFPTPSLGQDCLDILTTSQGYIKQGTSANCTCYVKTQGVPPGGVKWFYNNGTEVESITSNGSSILQVLFSGKEVSQSYKCAGVSVYGTDISMLDFTVSNAYGPEQLSLVNIVNDPVYDGCMPVIITIICTVPRDGVLPMPKINYDISDDETLELALTYFYDNSSHYMLVSSYISKYGGDVTYTCHASNSIFNEIGVVANLTVHVDGPPSQPPVLTIGQQSYNDSDATMLEPHREGSDIDITCQVFGGFPNTYNMTLSCGGNYNNSATNTDVVKLSIENVGKQLNGKQCVCKAEHVTSCYVNKTSSVTLNITYPARIQQFTGNSEVGLLTVSSNCYVTFICDVESNPPAIVYISKTETLAENITKVNFTKYVTCEDSGLYICQAHNSDFIQQVQNTILLFVPCPLMLKDTSANNTVFYAKYGGIAIIKYDVFGYPPPISYTLLEEENSRVHEIKFSVSYLLTSRYKIQYTSDALPYGNIAVTITNLTEQDFTKYILKVNNGFKTELQFHFVVTQEKASTNALGLSIKTIAGVVGGAVACLVCSAVIIVVVKRHIQNTSCRNGFKNSQETDAAESTGRFEVPIKTQTSNVINDAGYEHIDVQHIPPNYDRVEFSEEYDKCAAYRTFAVYDQINMEQINTDSRYEDVCIK